MPNKAHYGKSGLCRRATKWRELREEALRTNQLRDEPRWTGKGNGPVAHFAPALRVKTGIVESHKHNLLINLRDFKRDTGLDVRRGVGWLRKWQGMSRPSIWAVGTGSMVPFFACSPPSLHTVSEDAMAELTIGFGLLAMAIDFISKNKCALCDTSLQ